MEIFSFLNAMVEKGGSDLFFSVGAPVNLKIEGVTHPLKMPALQPGQVKQLAYSVMNEKQISEFEAKMEMNLSISAENLGRFRVNVFVQRGETGMVVRYIKSKIPPLAALGLPPILEKLVLRKRGLVLVTGATGSGKSTTSRTRWSFCMPTSARWWTSAKSASTPCRMKKHSRTRCARRPT